MHHRHSLISIHSQTQYSQIPTSHVHKYVKLNTYWPIRKRVHENYNAHAHTGTGEENYSLLRQRERERDSSTHPARKGKAYSSWVRAHGFKSSVTHIQTHRHKDTQSLRERERERGRDRERVKERVLGGGVAGKWRQMGRRQRRWHGGSRRGERERTIGGERGGGEL